MSEEPKKPQPGEWWQKRSQNSLWDKCRFFVIGESFDGSVVAMRKWLPHEVHDGKSPYEYGVLSGTENIEHLPDCDDWDWEPPAEPKICTNEELSKIVAELKQAVYHLTNRIFDLEQKVQ